MRFFKLKQGGFHGQTAAVADQTAVRADDAVTGSRDIDGVAVVRHADCAGGFRLPDCPGNIAVGARFAVVNVTQRRPDLALKRRALRAAGIRPQGYANGKAKRPYRMQAGCMAQAHSGIRGP